MALRINFAQSNFGPALRHGFTRISDRMVRAINDTMKQASDEILKLGRADIKRGIKATARWTSSLHADLNQDPISPSIKVFSTIPYFKIFEFGGVIKGRPLLWIPLAFAGVPKGTRARDFPGGLFRVDRKSGAPLLLSITDRKPKYFGKASVTIPRKFHIRDVLRTVAGKLQEFYSKNLKKNNG